jgi:sialidase-1
MFSNHRMTGIVMLATADRWRREATAPACVRHVRRSRPSSSCSSIIIIITAAAMTLPSCSPGISSAARQPDAAARNGGTAAILDAATREKSLAILRAGLQARDEADFWPAMHAAEGLTLAGRGGEVRGQLEPRLATEAGRRCGLARELVRAGDASKVAVLADILASPDPYGHIHAAESLFKVGEVGDAAAIERAFAQQENIKLRLMAAAALGRGGAAKPLGVIRDTLRGSDADGVMLAGWILGQIGGEADIEPIRSRLADAPTPLIRAYLEHALAMLGDADGLAALGRNLGSTDDAIRTAAANMAGEARALATAPTLVKLLVDPVPDIRIRAAQSLLMLER